MNGMATYTQSILQWELTLVPKFSVIGVCFFQITILLSTKTLYVRNGIITSCQYEIHAFASMVHLHSVVLNFRAIIMHIPLGLNQ